MVSLLVQNINRSSSALLDGRKVQSQTYMDNLEKQIDTIYMQEINLIDDVGAGKLAYSVYEDNYEKTQLILSLGQTLENIKSLNPLIEDIIITFPAQSIMISAQKGYEKREYYDVLKPLADGSYNYLTTNKGSMELRFIYPLLYSINKDYVPDYVVQILLSKDVLHSSLDIFSDEMGSAAALIYDNGEQLVIGDVNKTVISTWDRDNQGGFTKKLYINGSTYKFKTVSSSKYPLTLLVYINNRVLQQIVVKNIIVLTIITVVFSSLFFMSLLYTRRLIVKPLREMIDAFGKLQNGRFDVQIYHKPNDEFNYLYHAFNNTVTKIKILIDNIYEQENLLQNAELAQLQSQINPHFLYNSFFIINRMAKNEDYELITQFVTSLAKYYRFINKEQSNSIPLMAEIEHMENYIDIQQMRFGDKIKVEIGELLEPIQMIEVPKLILQPLIENAYEYGLVNKLSDGLIRITYAYDERFIKIIIEDNGDEADDSLIYQIRERLESNEEKEKGHALYNINRRLKLAYGKSSGLKIEKSILGGIKVILSIDCKKLV
jgi:two-component system sensor histidine kinase YesM